MDGNVEAFPGSIDAYASRKPLRSAHNDACVEVASLPAAMGVRDTKDRTRGHLAVSPDAWAHLLLALKH